MGGSTQTETQEQSFNNTENIDTGPWGPQQPYIERLFSEAGNLYDQGPMQYYPGQTYAGPSGASMAGIQGLMNLGNMGVQNDPLYGLAANFMGNSLGSVPQIGGIQDFLSNQLNPFSQIQAAQPGQDGAREPMQSPTMPGFPVPPSFQPQQQGPQVGGMSPYGDVLRGMMASPQGGGSNRLPGIISRNNTNNLPRAGMPQGGMQTVSAQGPRNPNMQQNLMPPNMGGGGMGMQPDPAVMNERQRIMAQMMGGR